MTREEAKELLPVMQAWAENKSIQVRINNEDTWTNLLDNKLEISKLFEYRIKPEPKYRPFKNQEECWEEMHKYPDFGWIKNKNTKDYCNIIDIYKIRSGPVKISVDNCTYTLNEAFNGFTFTNGTPFGIKEE